MNPRPIFRKNDHSSVLEKMYYLILRITGSHRVAVEFISLFVNQSE